MIEAVAMARFDYNQLEPAAQNALQEHKRRLGELTQKTAISLWQMGEVLADAQERLASYNGGGFVRWVEEEAGLSVGTAYRLIGVYKAFEISKLENAGLATSALYLLAEPSTPHEAREEALYRAERGESISHAKAREIVQQYRPLKPALPKKPPLPERPPSPEYREFEREELLPHLHDAGMPDAPQMLSGQCGELPPVSAERKEQARGSLREAIVEQLVACRGGAEVDACADEVMEVLGQSHNNLAISAQFGVALARGPQALSDLTAITVQVSGEYLPKMDRDAYLRARKRTLRLIDSLTFAGCGIYEHELENNQLCYSLLPCEEL